MATNSELRTAQKTTLFELLKLKKDNQDKTVDGLETLIAKTEAGMEQEDVAWVEKMVAKI